MNERIKELMKQATKEVWGNNQYNGAPEFEGTELDAEKFAELIIKECMALHDETIADYRKRRKVVEDLVYKDVYAEGEAACVRTKAKIKKHFGVE